MTKGSHHLQTIKTFLCQSTLSILSQKNICILTQSLSIDRIGGPDKMPIIWSPLFHVKGTHGVLVVSATAGTGHIDMNPTYCYSILLLI